MCALSGTDGSAGQVELSWQILSLLSLLLVCCIKIGRDESVGKAFHSRFERDFPRKLSILL